MKKNKSTVGSNNISGVNKWNTGASPGTNEWNLGIGGSGTDAVHFNIESGTSNFKLKSSRELVIGAWSHVIGMRKGSKMFIYIDGDQKGSLEIGNIAVNNVGLPLYIGRINAGYNSPADFDDIHIFNRALDLTEIRNLSERKSLEEIDEVANEQLAFGGYYRYGYQGQYAEEDGETGWNSFELRMYDAVIGRFNIVDPYRVGFSPYIGMGNDPTNKVDPDGGCPTGDCPGFEEGVSNSTMMLEGFTFSAASGGMKGFTMDNYKFDFTSWMFSFGPDNSHVYETQWKRDFDTFAGAGMNAVTVAIAAPFAAGMLGEGAGNLGAVANQGAASAYLWATGNSGAFATVTGFSVGVGRITYRYHGSFNAATRGRWSTLTNFSNSGAAFNKLALDYGKANFSRFNMGQFMFRVQQFGIYINGTAAPQNMSSGGGQQMLRVIGTDVIKQ